MLLVFLLRKKTWLSLDYTLNPLVSAWAQEGHKQGCQVSVTMQTSDYNVPAAHPPQEAYLRQTCPIFRVYYKPYICVIL